MNLQTLAHAVKSTFTQLQETEIIGRIMIISGRNFERSVKGFELLIAEKLIEESFIEPTTRGKFMALLNRNPNVKTLIQHFDCIPGKITLTEPQQIEFLPPPKLSEDEVRERLKFQNLDF